MSTESDHSDHSDHLAKAADPPPGSGSRAREAEEYAFGWCREHGLLRDRARAGSFRRARFGAPAAKTHPQAPPRATPGRPYGGPAAGGPRRGDGGETAVARRLRQGVRGPLAEHRVDHGRAADSVRTRIAARTEEFTALAAAGPPHPEPAARVADLGHWITGLRGWLSETGRYRV
ncbi:hypothetical protein GCM10010387_33500 [Streptomyces inusitatus]|uniref:Uncharacterized protein n=1 Tax=Streptomyces inusitatus TaxID=68221 RepID=A0A918Q7Y3_9ACTN|nr:hypothetical protein [Streptomyces inusitatus]GGZ36729.1 hypothetical protein GCM10010387_33500 [Streptomyces inusitatus]